MSSNTKIVVLRSKQLVYALVLVVISVLIIMTVVSLFAPQKKSTASPSSNETQEEDGTEPQSSDTSAFSSADADSDALYVPGIYSSAITLGSVNMELQITVDADRITSISLANLDESVTTLYPLMEPTLEELAADIIETQSLDDVSYTDENRYTSMLLLQAITTTLDKARIADEDDTAETSADIY